MDDLFVELGPLMLTSLDELRQAAWFAVPVACALASVGLRLAHGPSRYRRLLVSGVGMWASARDLQIPLDVFLIATLPLAGLRPTRARPQDIVLGLAAVAHWLLSGNARQVAQPPVVWGALQLFLYVASATTLPRAVARGLLAALRVWMPRNCIMLAAAFVWTGPGGVFARLGSVLLVALLGERFAVMTLVIAGLVDYISSLRCVDKLLRNG
jgi:hypothetical protein